MASLPSPLVYSRETASEAVPVSGDIRFGMFRLLVRERRLERDGVAVALGGRAMDLLTELLRRAGEVVSKADLSQAAWPGMVVEDGNLRFHIAALRRALNDDDMLKTIAGRGYCFTGAIAGRAEEPGEHRRFSTWNGPARRYGQGLGLGQSRRPIGIGQVAQEAAAELIARRFLTLVGPPGIGKTTLALELGRRLEQIYPDGIAFVDLSAMAAPGHAADTVAEAVIAALGRESDAAGDPSRLLALLKGRAMVLVLDGCDRVIDAAADLAAMLFHHVPGIAVLATSRECLRVEGEHVYHVPALACPPDEELTAAEALAYPAVEVFADRIRAGCFGYELRDEDAPCIARLCRRLDGIPLALELVAGRVATCGLAQVAALIESPMRLFWQGWRTAPARHQTLHAAVAWSHDLLDPVEQTVLRRLGVFAGMFSLGQAQAVSSDDAVCANRVVQALADLVARSLVLAEERDGRSLYRLLDMTRVYALSQLHGSGEAHDIAMRHAQCLAAGNL